LNPTPLSPPSPEADLPQDLSPRARVIAVVVWASFLASCAGTLFFFAFIAPVDLIGEEPQSGFMDHLSVYTLGFIGFWCVGALASAVALYLVRTPPGAPPTEPNIG